MSQHQPMSMEAMLDEERREVVALLEGNSAAARSHQNSSPLGLRSQSPFATPRSPVRSMLDVGDEPAGISNRGGKKSPTRLGPAPAPVRSMLDVDAPPCPPTQAPIRSMLDLDSRPGPASHYPKSGPTSPVEPNYRAHSASNTTHPRSLSDSDSRPVAFGPRSSASRLDPTAEYQFSDIITSNTGASLPKRNTQGGKHAKGSAMADVMRGNDVGGILLPGDRGRHHSIAMPGVRASSSTQSKSPHNRLGLRSNSPHASILSGAVSRVTSPQNMVMLDDGRMVDISNAYRKLSDANLVHSGGVLSQLPSRKRSAILNDGTPGRLEKDYLSPDGEEILEDTSDDNDSSSDEGERGRKKDRGTSDDALPGDYATGKDTDSAPGKPGRKTLSLLAAAEEERKHVASQQPKYQYRSLFDDPAITVTDPSGERVKPSKAAVHPTTSYDEDPGSGLTSAVDSDEDQEVTDIKRAQKLSFSMTPIISQPEAHRSIRMIYRGEYNQTVQQMEDEHHRLRKYLVATDMSDESTHALEWAIGTVLRDGDTLIAIYCVDEETGVVGSDSLVPDDPKAMKEQAAAINAVANTRTPPAVTSTVPAFSYFRSSAFGSDSQHSISPSPAPSTSSRTGNKGVEERQRAVKDISERVTRLLRKTQLEVRVIVEVIHCKNPKHLITEVIDLINPTLVILGSRGRSALKGVILGSFSNYLVTKSSVPVMVARKRLRKQSKYKRPVVRQVNNLSNPTARSLQNARID